MVSKEQAQRIKLGLLVLSGTLLLLFTLYFLSKNKSIFNSSFTIVTSFKNVHGLKAGNDIRYSGISIGTVKDVEIINDTSILVVLLLEKKVKKFIKNDALATIGSDGLMGDKIINILPGQSGNYEIEENQQIKSIENVSNDDLMRKLKNSNETVVNVVENVESITSNISQGKGNLGILLKDSTLAYNLNETVKYLKITTQQTAAVSMSLQVLIKKIERGEGMAGAIFYDTLLHRNLKEIVADLKHTSTTTKEVSSSLSTFTASVNDKNSALYLVLKDTSFAENLSNTMVNLKNGTEGFNQNMEGIKHSIFLRKYFKNKKKSIR